MIACPSGAMTCAILSPSKRSMASSTASRAVLSRAASILQRQSASKNDEFAKKSLTTLTRASSSFVRREVRSVLLAFAISGVNDDAERV